MYVAEQGDANALLHQGASVTREIEAVLTLGTGTGANEYAFRLAHAAADTLIFAEESFHYRRKDDCRPPKVRAPAIENRD